MSKIYIMPVGRLNLDDLREAFKKAKADARATEAASTVEGGKQNGPKPTA
jgi:hypothetical protein